MSLNGPRAILKRIVLANEGSWEVISRQIRPISRGFVPQTDQCSISTDVCDQRKQKADQMTEASSSSSPDRKRPRTEEMKSATKLTFYKMSENAFAPTRGSKLSAGFDLYSAYDCLIPANGKVLAKTDIQIALPDGCYGRVAPRSGLAWKHFIDVGAGVIDQDYRGNVGVVMFNFNKEDFKVSKGDRIAQLICERIYLPELEEAKVKLDETERGAGGFGSTGVSLKETNGSGDAKPTNGTEATTTNGTDAKTTNGTDAKAPNGTDAVSTNGTEMKESS